MSTAALCSRQPAGGSGWAADSSSGGGGGMPAAAGGSVPTSSLIGGPTPATARQGRHKQRYAETGERLVAGCIPIRYPGQAPSAETTEVMLITSRGGGWVFPKGGWEDDESLEAAARRETVEEAGVRGSIEEPLIGVFPFSSNKPSHSTNAHQGRCLAHMFVMRVAEELDTWPEYPQRSRLWVPLAEAGGKCRHPWMRDALQAWIARQGWQHLEAAPAAAPNGTTAAGHQPPPQQQ